uniref:Piezo non-specific cation channel cap domain-containing protein n=1 Tax=Amazona collaria TaxID=241587 RepID=A0A8B9FE59_9PSIT
PVTCPCGAPQSIAVNPHPCPPLRCSGMGGLIILFLVAIIWFLLLFMLLVHSIVGIVNHPIHVTVTLKLGGYKLLFTISAQHQSIHPFTPQDYEALTNEFERQPVNPSLLCKISPALSCWVISPPSREQMRQELQNGPSDITLRLTWTFQRYCWHGEEGTALPAPLGPHTARMQLSQLLQGTCDIPVQVPKLFPKYVWAPNGPEANPCHPPAEGENSYLDVRVQLKQEHEGWWVVWPKEPPPRWMCVSPHVLQDHGAVCLHCAAGAGGGALRQAHLPLPLSRDLDQADAGEGIKGKGLFPPLQGHHHLNQPSQAGAASCQGRQWDTGLSALTFREDVFLTLL